MLRKTLLCSAVVAIFGAAGMTADGLLKMKLNGAELHAQSCGVNNGNLCRKTCIEAGCGGCCDQLYFYYPADM